MRIRGYVSLLALAALALGGCAQQSSEVTPEVSPVTQAGPVQIEWLDPNKYTDITSSSELQSRFSQRVFDTLTANLAQVATPVLEPNEKLQLVVTNVDLAGDVRPTFGAALNDIRIVSNLYPPRITFTYKVLSGNQVVMSGSEKLQNLGFLDGIQPIIERPFMYESALLTTWFNQTLAPTLQGTPPQ
ncbi:DUF3016 domain-containing protein [Shewanella sp. NIFS-20-20]|uniref:DUF3016 domain-containing protein n=1 Tax=Shewanella sp. NIFS-20-20 TaxID=2853806 RepID=UPI001C489AA0|nr:DUF3016 domain-containing protein [Shewanella sp. NIFS-20-20]MBV7316186.1 DUF3016 domain-containing protein [Shewanella sp. NIFS-20-20]